ncbi:MAG: amino acid ABC transporter substrate-binding protein, partial [Thermoprotei archaeon]
MNKNIIAVAIIALIIGAVLGYIFSLSKISELESKINKLQQELEHYKTGAITEKEGLVEKIRKRGKLIVGTSADWPPFEYIDKNGQFAGIDIELAKRIADELGVELEIKDMKFAALIESLVNGKIDLILADMTPTAEREKVVDFSIPYYFSKGNAVITLKDKSLNSEEDLYGKKIGVQLGTIQEEWAKENLEGKAEIKSYDKVYPDLLMVLKRGDVDAIIVGDKIADVLTKKDDTIKIAFYVGGTGIGAAVAMPQGAEDLKYIVNSVIEKLLSSGEMEKIFQQEIDKWLTSQG